MKKIGENILRYENHQKIFIRSEFVAYKSIDKDASKVPVVTKGVSWSDVDLYEPMIKRVLTGPRLITEISG